MIKRWLGLDLIDLVIHLGVTFSLMGVVSASRGPMEVIPMIFAGSLVVLGIRRHFALRNSPPLSSGEFTAERLNEVEERLREFDGLQNRVVELDERLDFAERLLARQPESQAKLQGK